MFWKKNKVTIEGFGDLKYNKKGFFTTKIELLGKQCEMVLYFEDSPSTAVLTAEQEAIAVECFEKVKDIENYIVEYYKENCEEFVEEYYASLHNWDACCRSEEDFKKIIGEEDDEKYKLLLSYFEPQWLALEKSGEFVLMAFVAVYDDHGIAIRIKPKFEVMTQVEYYEEYQGTDD